MILDARNLTISVVFSILTDSQLSQKIPKNNLESFYKMENINGMR